MGIESTIWSIVYVSTATSLLSEDELESLLSASRLKNEQIGITGILLYHDGNFMQIIEGPKQAVVKLYAQIRGDALHKNLITLLDCPVEERLFAGWWMEFRNLNKLSVEELENASPYLEKSLLSDVYVNQPNKSLKLLQFFLRSTSR